MSEPSMEDILASIRKILSEETMDEQQEATPEPDPPPEEPAVMPEPDPEPEIQENNDVFELSEAQIVSPTPPPKGPDLVAQPVAKASACTLTYLAQLVAEDRMASLGNAGLTIEEIVKETVRPIVKEWLNHNLYDMVERLVRKEIEKVVDKVQV